MSLRALLMLAVTVVVLALLIRRMGLAGLIASIVGVCAICALALLFMPARRQHGLLATVESPVRIPGGGLHIALASPCNDYEGCDDCEECDTTELVVETGMHHGPYTLPYTAPHAVARSASTAAADVQAGQTEYRIYSTQETTVFDSSQGPAAPRPPTLFPSKSRQAPWPRGAAYQPERALPVSWTVVSAAALAAMIYLAYLFLDAGTRGQLTWLLRLFSVVAFLAICGFLVLYGRGL